MFLDTAQCSFVELSSSGIPRFFQGPSSLKLWNSADILDFINFLNLMNSCLRNCKADGKPVHLFRLLLLYPELCTFLDTKKCAPELYAQRWVGFSNEVSISSEFSQDPVCTPV